MKFNKRSFSLFMVGFWLTWVGVTILNKEAIRLFDFLLAADISMAIGMVFGVTGK